MNNEYIDLKPVWRKFIINNIIADDVQLNDGDDIFKLGYVNSIFALKLLGHIEKTAGILIEDDDVIVSNFCSITAIEKLVERTFQSINS